MSQVSDQLRSNSSDYKNLLDDLISVFEKLSQVIKSTMIIITLLSLPSLNQFEYVPQLHQDLNSQRSSAEASPSLNRESLHEVRALLEHLESFDRLMSDTFRRAKQETDKIMVKIQNVEPANSASQDSDKLNRSFKLVVDEWNSYSSTNKARLQERLDFCLFGDDLDKINAELRDLADQLGMISKWLGESLAGAKNASEAFTVFEKTLAVSVIICKNFSLLDVIYIFLKRISIIRFWKKE